VFECLIGVLIGRTRAAIRFGLGLIRLLLVDVNRQSDEDGSLMILMLAGRKTLSGT
jgi:hypothetical protein